MLASVDDRDVGKRRSVDDEYLVMSGIGRLNEIPRGRDGEVVEVQFGAVAVKPTGISRAAALIGVEGGGLNALEVPRYLVEMPETR